MPYSTIIQQDDVGVSLLITVIDGNTGQPKDISAATNIMVLLRRGHNSTKHFTGNFVTDGTDGQVFYTTQPGDLDDSGNWFIQVTYLFGGKQRYTSEDVFVVASNL